MALIDDLKSGKVKPEFGNLEHIQAIKAEEKKQDQCTDCNGEGWLTCEHCDGEGSIQCETCEGSGEKEVNNENKQDKH